MRNTHLAIRFIWALGMIGTASLVTAQTAEKKTLTLRGAESVISAAKVEAEKLQSPGGVIAVVDENIFMTHGRGIFLINRLMDEVNINFDHGTAIYMRRKLSSRDARLREP